MLLEAQIVDVRLVIECPGFLLGGSRKNQKGSGCRCTHPAELLKGVAEPLLRAGAAACTQSLPLVTVIERRPTDRIGEQQIRHVG